MSPAASRYRSSAHVFAVDPGEKYCGFAHLELLGPRQPTGHQCDCWFGHSSDNRLRFIQCLTFSPPAELFTYLETNLRHASVLVVERFQLYPWLAREQGFSSFGTAETIGVLRYLASRPSHSLPFVLQDSARNLKEGRAWAARCGFPMTPRKLGSGRFSYVGPDFSIPGRPHRRDAAAHAFQYLCSSGLYSPPATKRNEGTKDQT